MPEAHEITGESRFGPRELRAGTALATQAAVFRRSTAPLLLPACALVLGVLAGRPGWAGPWAWLVLGGAVAALPRTPMRGAAVLAVFFSLGCLRAARTPVPAVVRTDGPELHLLRWVGPGPGARGAAAIAQGDEWRRVGVAWDRASPEPRRGDTWVVRGRLSPSRRRSGPPLLRVGRRAAVRVAVGRSGPDPLSAVRGRLGRTLDRGARTHETQRLLRALVLGESRGIPPRLRESFARAGVAHLLAISGLHVGMIAGLAVAIVRRPLRRAAARRGSAAARTGALDPPALLIGLAVAGAYVVVAGAPVSSRRAWWMLAAVAGALSAGRGPVGWNVLGAAGIAVAWTSPGVLRTVGTGLSFAAVAGLLAAAPLLDRVRPAVPRLARPVVTLLAASVVAAVATAPLVGYAFGRVPLAGVWTNVLAIPAFGVLLPVALTGSAVGVLAEGPGAAIVGLADRGFSLLVAGVDWVAAPARSPVLIWQPPALLVIGVYAAWVLLLLRGDRR